VLERKSITDNAKHKAMMPVATTFTSTDIPKAPSLKLERCGLISFVIASKLQFKVNTIRKKSFAQSILGRINITHNVYCLSIHGEGI